MSENLDDIFEPTTVEKMTADSHDEYRAWCKAKGFSDPYAGLEAAAFERGRQRGFDEAAGIADHLSDRRERRNAMMDERKRLDGKGRCCGIKPLVYKRPPHLFCFRCDAAFDTQSGEQIENWTYALVDGKFRPRATEKTEMGE